ncbi:MAG: GMC oxidoreductase [Sandaracinaceae bacterium]
MMRRYHRIAASLLLVPDSPSGCVRPGENGRPIIGYTHRGEHKSPGSARRPGRRRGSASPPAQPGIGPDRPARPASGAKRDIQHIDAMDLRPATAPLLSAHQQGTARMSASAAEGAIDPDGQVWGTRGIYVMDASMFPAARRATR